MSDDFVVAREFKDGWYYADLGASYWWSTDKIYPDLSFRYGPFPTEEDAVDAALENSFVEYGVEPDNKPTNLPVTEHPRHATWICTQDGRSKPGG